MLRFPLCLGGKALAVDDLLPSSFDGERGSLLLLVDSCDEGRCGKVELTEVDPVSENPVFDAVSV